MKTNQAAHRKRHQGVEAFRFIAAIAVVLLHSLPQNDAPSLPNTLAAIGCRFAVPFFFLVSGYYLVTTGRSRVSLVISPFRKLMPILVGTIAIYYLASSVVPLGAWSGGLADLRTGPIFHLWFLPVLALSLALAGLGASFLGLPITIIMAVGLAVYGLATTTYGDVFGSAHAGSRSGWYYGTALITLGMAIRRWDICVRRSTAVAMVLASYLLLVLEEVLLLHVTSATGLRSHDFTVATFAFGVAVLLLARSIDDGPLVRLFAAGGRLSLGIYAFHVLFLRIFQAALDGKPHATLVIALATLLTTILFTWAAAHVPILRMLVAPAGSRSARVRPAGPARAPSWLTLQAFIAACAAARRAIGTRYGEAET